MSQSVTGATPPADGFHELPRQQVVWTLAGVLLALLLAALDQTIVSTALPRVIADLHGFEHYAWVFTSYMVASTTVVPLVGRLTDLYGRKWFMFGAVVIFLGGSALCGASQSMLQLIIFRAIQGIGAGVLMSTVFTLIGDLFPPAERGKYQGLTAGIFGISSVLGPTTGGYITDFLSWRWVFYVNLPLGLIVLIVLFRFFPEIRPVGRRHSLDIAGVVTLTLSVVPLLLALSWAGTTYPWNSPITIGLFTFAAVMALAFILIERRAVEPIVPLDLFGNRIVSISILVVVLMGFGMFGAILFVPLFIQGVLGATATESGQLLTAMTLAVVTASIISGQALSRLGGRYRIQALIGLALMGFGSFLLSQMSVAVTSGELIRNLVLVGLGLGTIMPLFTIAVQNAVPYERLGVATSVTQFFRSIGGTVGVAVLGTVMTNRFGELFLSALPDTLLSSPIGAQLATLAQNPQALVNPEARGQLEAALGQTGSTAETFALVLGSLREALAASVHDVFLVATLTVAAAWAACLFLPEIPLRRHNVRSQPVAAGDEVATSIGAIETQRARH